MSPLSLDIVLLNIVLIRCQDIVFVTPEYGSSGGKEYNALDQGRIDAITSWGWETNGYWYRLHIHEWSADRQTEFDEYGTGSNHNYCTPFTLSSNDYIIGYKVYVKPVYDDEERIDQIRGLQFYTRHGYTHSCLPPFIYLWGTSKYSNSYFNNDDDFYYLTGWIIHSGAIIDQIQFQFTRLLITSKPTTNPTTKQSTHITRTNQTDNNTNPPNVSTIETIMKPTVHPTIYTTNKPIANPTNDLTQYPTHIVSSETSIHYTNLTKQSTIANPTYISTIEPITNTKSIATNHVESTDYHSTNYIPMINSMNGSTIKHTNVWSTNGTADTMDASNYTQTLNTNIPGIPMINSRNGSIKHTNVRSTNVSGILSSNAINDTTMTMEASNYTLYDQTTYSTMEPTLTLKERPRSSTEPTVLMHRTNILTTQPINESLINYSQPINIPTDGVLIELDTGLSSREVIEVTSYPTKGMYSNDSMAVSHGLFSFWAEMVIIVLLGLFCVTLTFCIGLSSYIIFTKNKIKKKTDIVKNHNEDIVINVHRMEGNVKSMEGMMDDITSRKITQTDNEISLSESGDSGSDLIENAKLPSSRTESETDDEESDDDMYEPGSVAPLHNRQNTPISQNDNDKQHVSIVANGSPFGLLAFI